MTPSPERASRFSTFVNVFVPFALLVTVANLDAELGLFGSPDPPAEAGRNPTLARIVYSIWITFVFATPAYVLFGLYDLRRAPANVYRYWRLFWSFAYLAYLIHFYYAFVVWFEGRVDDIAERQGWLVLGTNFAVTVLWGIDVVVSVVGGQRAGNRALYVYQWVTHLLLLAAIYVSSVKFKSGFVVLLGGVLTAAFVGCLLVRLKWGDMSKWSRATGSQPTVVA